MTVPRDTLQHLNLIQEIELSMAIIESGLALLQRSRPYKTKHFVFLTLLSSGVERMLKVILHLQALNTTGEFLSKGTLKQRRLSTAWNGHDLVRLCESAVAVCFTPEYLQRPVAVQDRDFIRHDEILTDMLQLLSDFAMGHRYIYMDDIIDPGTTKEWPSGRWEKLEIRTMAPGEYTRLVFENNYDIAKQHANQALVVSFERFLRALARLFTLASLGDEARRVSPAVSRFWRLDDQDLGKTDYEV